jgi:hypothetical protein
MKPIHKFNSGIGAMLCNGCRVIISTGPKTEELFCTECKEKCDDEICSACQIYAAKKGSNHCESCGPLIKNWIEQMYKELHKS